MKKKFPDINIIYSTPACYVKAVHDDAAKNNKKFNSKTDDFMPYASSANAYWSGFYTSRPNSKRLERMGNNLLQTTKQLIAFERIKNNTDFSKDLTLLSEAMGIMQHHDAITGTEKQAVANDYARLLTKAMKNSESNVAPIIL